MLEDRALLSRLVGFDTTSRESNLPLADFLADYLDRPGVRVARNPSADGTKTNLIVAIGPEADDREGLVLSGHMDVVPAEESDWRSDPFTLTESGDRYLGRGTADMKGFLALATNRLAAFCSRTTRKLEPWARGASPRHTRPTCGCPGRSSSASPRRCASCVRTRGWFASGSSSQAGRRTRVIRT
jgi:Peptidase family M20/M25/M40